MSPPAGHQALPAPSAAILGPTRVEMGIRLNVTLQATALACLQTRKGQVIFAGTGRNAGLEVQGGLERLLRGD